MRELYDIYKESLLDDEEDIVNDESGVELQLVEKCFQIDLFKNENKSRFLILKPNGHFEYNEYTWSEMCENLINLPIPVIFDHMKYLDFNGNTTKENWNDSKDIKIVFKNVDEVVIQSNKSLPKWIGDLKIEKCNLMKIFCQLDNNTYSLPPSKIKNLKINVKPHGISRTLWQVDDQELLIGNYKNIDAENVIFCTDQMIIRGIMPFNDPRQTDTKINHLTINKDDETEFVKFFANNPKVKHLYVYISDNSPYLRRSLYYEVLPMATKGKFKLKRTTLRDDNFE